MSRQEMEVVSNEHRDLARRMISDINNHVTDSRIILDRLQFRRAMQVPVEALRILTLTQAIGHCIQPEAQADDMNVVLWHRCCQRP